MEYHRKKGTKSSKNPITGRRDFIPVSRNVMHEDVQMSKYRGWGSKTEILNTKFDDFWKKNWVKLFGFKKHPKTKERITEPKFELSREVKGQEMIAIRLSILVNEELSKENAGYALDVAEKLHKSEYKKGWYKHAHLFDTEHYSDSNKGKNGVKEVRDNISRYKC